MISSALALIPARHASTRFPGKLLKTIQGKSILEIVYREMMTSSRFSEVAILSGDKMISAECKRIGANFVDAFDDYLCGTDRCLEGFPGLDQYDIIVNVQADQPSIQHWIVDQLVDFIEEDPVIQVASLMTSEICTDPNPDIVKVYVDDDFHAIDFSRTLHHKETAFRHIGVYAFSRSGVKRIVEMKPTQRELNDRLEQLRWLENEMSIHMVPVNYVPVSIDSPKDLNLMSNDN